MCFSSFLVSVPSLRHSIIVHFTIHAIVHVHYSWLVCRFDLTLYLEWITAISLTTMTSQENLYTFKATYCIKNKATKKNENIDWKHWIRRKFCTNPTQTITSILNMLQKHVNLETACLLHISWCRTNWRNLSMCGCGALRFRRFIGNRI